MKCGSPTPSAWAEPTSISVETFGTGQGGEALLVKLVREFFGSCAPMVSSRCWI